MLAYEVFCRVCDVFDNRAVGIDYAMVIGLAAAAGAGRMLGLTPQQIVHAIGIYVAGGVALNQTRVGTLSNWKACAAAEAARQAIFAVQLAQAGMTGPNQVFEGPDGFFARISRKPFALPKLGGGGAPFGIMHCFTKRFTLGQFAQTVAQAAVEARAFFADVGEIARGEYPGVAQGDPGHGGQSRQMAAADPRDRRPQHALCGRGGADLRHGRGAALRRPVSARPAPARPGRPGARACRPTRPIASGRR